LRFEDFSHIKRDLNDHLRQLYDEETLTTDICASRSTLHRSSSCPSLRKSGKGWMEILSCIRADTFYADETLDRSPWKASRDKGQASFLDRLLQMPSSSRSQSAKEISTVESSPVQSTSQDQEDLVTFLVIRCSRHRRLAHFLYWYLTAESESSKNTLSEQEIFLIVLKRLLMV